LATSRRKLLRADGGRADASFRIAERRHAQIPLRRMGGALREIRVFAWPPLPLR
jgi:hypothetical protein